MKKSDGYVDGTNYDYLNWKQIPGYDGFYEVNTDGVVRTWRTNHKGVRATEPKTLKVQYNNGSTFVTLRGADGKEKTMYISRIMAIVFLGGIPDGMIAYHKDRNPYNTHLYNIGVAKRSEVSKGLGGKYNRKPVLKVNKEGEILEVFRSVSEAAKKCFMNKSQVTKHLKNQVKNPFLFQDWTFVYDE